MCADVNQLHAVDSKVGLGKTLTKDEEAKINLQSPQNTSGLRTVSLGRAGRG